MRPTLCESSAHAIGRHIGPGLSPPTHFCACVGISQKKRTVCVCFFDSRSSQSVAIHFSSHLSRLERCLLVPVTSLFAPYRLAAHTHDVVRLWPLDPSMLYLYDGLHGFCLVCGRRIGGGRVGNLRALPD